MVNSKSTYSFVHSLGWEEGRSRSSMLCWQECFDDEETEFCGQWLFRQCQDFPLPSTLRSKISIEISVAATARPGQTIELLETSIDVSWTNRVFRVRRTPKRPDSRRERAFENRAEEGLYFTCLGYGFEIAETQVTPFMVQRSRLNFLLELLQVKLPPG